MPFPWPEELIFLRNARLPQHDTDAAMSNKVVVLSGGTSGVGLAALKEFVKGGASIVLVSRNLDKAKRIVADLGDGADERIDHVYADFAKLDTVRDAAKDILSRYPTIDVLVNSAGIYSTKKRRNDDGFELVFCVNHLAPFLFTKLLLPSLQRGAPARIIQVNSEGHRFAGVRLSDLQFKRRIYTGLRSYGASKTAQLLTVWEMAKELDGSGVTICAMHPGAVRSNIGHNSGPLYRFWLNHVLWHFLKDPAIAGRALYFLAADPSLRDITGTFFHLTNEEPPARHARPSDKGRTLYEATMELVGLATKERETHDV